MGGRGEASPDTHTRRSVLAALGGSLVGFSGCSMLGNSGDIALQWATSDVCVVPLERDRPVEEFYGYGQRRPDRAHNDRGQWVENATVTFLYRDGRTDALSLCVVHGSPGRGTSGGGRAIITFEGVAGTNWKVRDDPPGDAGGDSYDSATESPDATETVLWEWPGNQTDGVAIGNLGQGFDLTLTHRSSATVDGEAVRRTGLNRWLFVDGAAPDTPIEVARFDRQDERDPTITLTTGRC